MSDDIKKDPTPPAPPATQKTVTSSVTIDFPEFGWGINAGCECELPADDAAQKAILANPNIKLKTK